MPTPVSLLRYVKLPFPFVLSHNTFQRLAGPASLVALGALSVETTHAKESLDLQKIREAIVDVIETDQEKRGDGTSLYGTMIRLAWHCAGTYSDADKVS